MSTVKSKKLQVGTDATSSNNFTIYQPASPDGTLRIGVGNADSPTEVGRFNSNGLVPNNKYLELTLSSDYTLATAWNNIALDQSTGETSWYNSSNQRITPNIAGWYYFSWIAGSAAGTTRWIVSIRKNLGEYHRGTDVQGTAVRSGEASGLVYLNGTTDNIEPRVWTQTAVDISSNPQQTSMRVILIR